MTINEKLIETPLCFTILKQKLRKNIATPN